MRKLVDFERLIVAHLLAGLDGFGALEQLRLQRVHFFFVLGAFPVEYGGQLAVLLA